VFAEPGSSRVTNQMISPIRATQNTPMNSHMNGAQAPIPAPPYQSIIVVPFPRVDPTNRPG
jgi:hypothetical protein